MALDPFPASGGAAPAVAAKLLRTGFSVHADDIGADQVVFHLAGELDMATAGELRQALDGVRSATTAVVLDLAGLTFADVTGIGVIRRAEVIALGRGGTLTVREPRRNVLKALRLMGIDHLHEPSTAAAS